MRCLIISEQQATELLFELKNQMQLSTSQYVVSLIDWDLFWFCYSLLVHWNFEAGYNQRARGEQANPLAWIARIEECSPHDSASRTKADWVERSCYCWSEGGASVGKGTNKKDDRHWTVQNWSRPYQIPVSGYDGMSSTIFMLPLPIPSSSVSLELGLSPPSSDMSMVAVWEFGCRAKKVWGREEKAAWSDQLSPEQIEWHCHKLCSSWSRW